MAGIDWMSVATFGCEVVVGLLVLAISGSWVAAVTVQGAMMAAGDWLESREF